MTRYLSLAILFLVSTSQLLTQNTITENLIQHVYTLADDSLKGRKAGSHDSEKAAEYILNQWKKIGIESYRNDSYFHYFDSYKNIIGIIQGNDPILKHEYIVIGAHYDHIGFKIKHGDTIVYNGADDNASGSATLIEIAAQLKKRQGELKRSIILVAFDAEEIGLLGSNHFISDAIFPVDKIKLMMSIDMVGWYAKNGAIIYSGSATAENLDKIIKSEEITPEALNVETEDFEKNIWVATDTKAFAQAGIPTLAVTTGIKSPYHKPEDDADLIDYKGMTLITEHLVNLTIKLSNEENISPTGKTAVKHRKTGKRFEVGILTNIGSNSHYYTAGAVNGKSAFSYGIGLTGKINMAAFAIRPEVFFESVSGKHPHGYINTKNITVPVNFVLQTKNSFSNLEIFVGPYYSYHLNGTQGKETINFEIFNQYEWGLNWGVGLNMGPIKIGYTMRNALTNFTRLANNDNAYLKNRAGYFTIGWMF